MMTLTKTQARVLNEIKESADSEGEAFISKFNKWNTRTLKALSDKNLVIFFGGETVSLANHPEQIRAANFAKQQNIT
jgi:hypothetical protein